MDFETLNQINPEYDEKLWTRIELLYEGGYEILKHAQVFIPRLPGEGEKRYRYRVQHASYIPYVGQIVGYLVGALFSSGLTVLATNNESEPADPPDPFYAAFAKDADLEGKSFQRILRRMTSDALLFRRGVVCIDMPPALEGITTRADEEAYGAGRAYTYNLRLDQLLDWERSPDRIEEVPAADGSMRRITRPGRFKWAITRSMRAQRASPSATRGKFRWEFMVWSFDEEHHAVWERWTTAELDEVQWRDYCTGAGQQGRSKLEIQSSGQGVTSFTEIPIVELRLPKSLWVGNKIGPLAEEHFCTRSELRAGMAEANVEIPLIKLGPEIPAVGGALPSEAQQDAGRGDSLLAMYRAQGYSVIGSEDDFSFVGPSGSAFEITSQGLDGLRDEMFRVVHAMAQGMENSAAALGRSAESKHADRSAEGIVLTAVADYVRGAAIDLYDIISAARRESVNWSAHGLDSFDIDDEATVEEAAQIDTLDIPSKTFHVEYLTSVAMRYMPNATPQIKEAIKKEIAAGIEEREAEAAVRRDQLLDPNAPDPNAPDPNNPGDEQPGDGEMPPTAPLTNKPGGAPRPQAPKGPSVGAG